MKINFVTTNKHKFEEVKDILKNFDIEILHLDMEYDENHDLTMKEIVRKAVKRLADKLGKPIVIEDTGLFFDAYNNFPGVMPKFVINSIGFKGIFKLLDGESRVACFRTIAGFCEPGKEPNLFEGKMDGEITEKVYNPEKEELPYDKIFIPKGKDKVISDMTMEEKNSFSQRAEAFKKFGGYINDINR